MTYRKGVLIAVMAGCSAACSSRVDAGHGAMPASASRTDAGGDSGGSCAGERCVAVAEGGTAVADGRVAVADGNVSEIEGGSAPKMTNPTGVCTAPNDGARPAYHSPGPGEVWLPDCRNTLKREYWRVFAKSEASAYVIPRPDGLYQIKGSVCLTPDHPLGAVVDKYGLCEQATSAADVARVNDMVPVDALAVTHYLHTQLLFETSVNMFADPTPPPTIVPFPIPGDVLDACALHPDQNSAGLQAVCDQERQYVETGADLSPSYGGVAAELASLLNELYGVGADCAGGEVPRHVCMRCGPTGGCPQLELHCSKPCRSSTECAGVSTGNQCNLESCGPAASCF